MTHQIERRVRLCGPGAVVEPEFKFDLREYLVAQSPRHGATRTAFGLRHPRTSFPVPRWRKHTITGMRVLALPALPALPSPNQIAR
jgi:hypothetical protein